MPAPSLTTSDLLAELVVLARVDRRRRRAGHDYGGGQRYAELQRRERELRIRAGGSDVAEREVDLATDGDPGELTLRELQAAAERVVAPKLRRITREQYRAGSTATRRTREALAATLLELELDADVVHLMTGSSTVACGAPMRDPDHPNGWDLGDVVVDAGAAVSCPRCRLETRVSVYPPGPQRERCRELYGDPRDLPKLPPPSATYAEARELLGVLELELGVELRLGYIGNTGPGYDDRSWSVVVQSVRVSRLVADAHRGPWSHRASGFSYPATPSWATGAFPSLPELEQLVRDRVAAMPLEALEQAS